MPVGIQKSWGEGKRCRPSKRKRFQPPFLSHAPQQAFWRLTIGALCRNPSGVESFQGTIYSFLGCRVADRLDDVTERDWVLPQYCEMMHVANPCMPGSEKRHPPWEPLRPVRLYFVSVAPPWGGNYFWDESKGDNVREGLFKALRSLPKPLEGVIDTCRQFRDARLFLTPAVKCPSSKDNKDLKPSPSAIANCAHFLRSELTMADAERILALGQVPFRAVCNVFGIRGPKRVAEFRKKVTWVQLGQKKVPLLGTYFPGNNRHRGFPLIVEDIGRLLDLTPQWAGFQLHASAVGFS